MKLSERESQVYELILKGYTYNEMAKTLSLNHTTVEALILSLFNKKGVWSKEELLLQEIEALKTKLEQLAEQLGVL